MSSLAASKADNFYYPPEWRPEYGGISKFQGSSGKNQYEKYGVIRFELPFDVWCLHCERHMSKGLRFNAKKDQAGKYFTTTIWQFTMKCYTCDQQIVIKTDPANNTYELCEGLRRHEQEYTPDEDDGAINILSDEQRASIAKDAMLRLEHTQETAIRALTAQERLEHIISIREETTKDDYHINSILRARNRVKRKREQAEQEAGRNKGLRCALLPASSDDAAMAHQVRFRSDCVDHHKQSEQRRMASLQAQPLLGARPTVSESRPSALPAALLRPAASKLVAQLANAQARVLPSQAQPAFKITPKKR